MKLVVRADGGGEVGLGHLSRAGALAEVLSSHGVEVAWAARPSEAAVRLLGREPDLPLEGVPSFDPLPPDEARRLGAFALGADWVVLDHYGATAAWISALREAAPGVRILRFDDLGLDLGEDLRLAPLLPSGGRTLGGLEHLVLRPAFAHVPRSPRSGLLVALGGSTSCGGAGPALEEVLAGAGDRRVTVVSPDPAVATAFGDRAEVLSHLDAGAMAHVLASAEGALVGSSVLAWEALALRTPIVALRWSPNQVSTGERLREHGVPVLEDGAAAGRALALGRATLGTSEGEVDGFGAFRVARALGADVPLPRGAARCRLRPAAAGDAERLFRWANDPVERSFSFSPDPIPWEDHLRWLGSSLDSPDRLLFVCETEGGPAGVLRLDRDLSTWDVSINLDPGRRGAGLGSAALRALTSEAARRGLRRLRAFVLPENPASAKAFEAAGYDPAGRRELHGREALVYLREPPRPAFLEGLP